MKKFTYSSRSSSDSDGDAPQNADIVDDIFYLWNKKIFDRKKLVGVGGGNWFGLKAFYTFHDGVCCFNWMKRN